MEYPLPMSRGNRDPLIRILVIQFLYESEHARLSRL